MQSVVQFWYQYAPLASNGMQIVSFLFSVMFMEQSWREMMEKTWCSDFALCPVNLARGAWQAKRLTVGNPVGLFFLDSCFQINPIFLMR